MNFTSYGKPPLRPGKTFFFRTILHSGATGNTVNRGIWPPVLESAAVPASTFGASTGGVSRAISTGRVCTYACSRAVGLSLPRRALVCMSRRIDHPGVCS